MKKHGSGFYEVILVIVLLGALFLTQVVPSASVRDPEAGKDANGYPLPSVSLTDLEKPDTVFGCLVTGDWESKILSRYPEAEICFYNTTPDLLAALEAGKIDAAGGYINRQGDLAETHPDIAFITEPFARVDVGVGMAKSERGERLRKEMNEYLRKLRESGEYDRLLKKWEDPERTGDVMEERSFSGEKGNLTVAAFGEWVPMSFFVGKTLTGFFSELVNDFCATLGYTPVYEVVSGSAGVLGLASGNYDIALSAISYTSEREQSILISDPVIENTYYLMVPAAAPMKKVSGWTLFTENLKASIRRTFITEDRYKILLSGLYTTLLLTLESGVLGTLLGMLISFLRRRRNPFISAIGSLYIRVFRMLPLVVLLLVLNYVVFRRTGISAFYVCVITFSLEFSAYCAEIFSTGISSVPEGQHKAARALGFGKLQAFRRIIWPQAMVQIMPVYIGQLIAMVKMTAIAGYISVMDLTKASDIIRSQTYDALFPLIFTALEYLLICYVLTALLEMPARRLMPSHRKVRKDIRDVVGSYTAETAKVPAVFRSGRTEDSVLLSARHLKKSFGDVTPVRDMSFEIRQGDVIAVIGPSGTGKSTFLNLLNQMERPDEGTIIFEGRDTLEKGYDVRRMRQQIGMVFQSFYLFSHLTVVENLMLPQVLLKKTERRAACRKSMELLYAVGLADKALSFPDQLSGGQQQRVAIVRAVAMDPQILLFDEPTSALDPATVDEVLSVIRKLAHNGMTMLIVTHEMQFARDVSNRVLFLDEGVICEEGTPDQIFGAPKKDHTRRFINHLRVLEFRISAKGFDAPDMFRQIGEFSFRHMIGRKLMNGMMTTAEELGMNLLMPLAPESGVRLSFEYGGGDTVGLEAVYEGKNLDPMEKGDPMSVALVRHACRDLVWEWKNGSCRVRAKLE